MQVIDIKEYPSVVATEKENWGSTTEKYQFVPTTKVINVLADHGWYPVKAEEARVIASEKEGYQRHMLRFRQEGSPSLSRLNEAFTEIVLLNAHDGSTMFNMMAGVFVMVCGNGLVVADRLYETHRIKHIGFTERRVEEAIESVLAAVPKIGSHIDLYSNMKLTRKEQLAFADNVLQTKYDEFFLKTHHIDPESLFDSVRPEEKEPTLWNTFNIVQEKVIDGGIRYHQKDEHGLYDSSKWRKSRKITNIQENIRLNKALWGLVENTALLKSAN